MTIILPDELVVELSVAFLPSEALVRDRVAVYVEDGEVLDTWLLPRIGGLQA